MRLSVWLVLLSVALIHALGPLPDASQEGLVWQYKGYSSVTFFHYTVPSEVTRATWEFASFQDQPLCPSRKVHVFIQQGSFPVFSADNTSFPDSFHVDRTSSDHFTVHSAYQPKNSAVYPIYNPLPGSWFVAAYLEPFPETLGFGHKCRYSLVSVALWNLAETVELILPNAGSQLFTTRKHFSYYKFYVPDGVHKFQLLVDNCKVNLKGRALSLSDSNHCIDFLAVRGKALPLHDPRVGSNQADTISFDNLTVDGNVTFTEQRPFLATYYYILVVTQGQVSFNISLNFFDCGMSGLYGPGQQDWYLDEKGLIWSDKTNDSHPKEPKTGFQLFTSKISSEDLVDNFDLDSSPGHLANKETVCVSTFDMTRMDNVTPFSVGYVFQGKSWYTKWVTVLEKIPVFARLDSLDFLDLGGFLNIRVTMDDDEREVKEIPDDEALVRQEIHICVSKDRSPRVQDDGRSMVCDSPTASMKLTNTSREALKVIPYPEPGKWFIGFQIRCVRGHEYVACLPWQAASMVAVDIRLQPCGYQGGQDVCGQHGVCATTSKGAFRLTSCNCISGYKGWTCEDDSGNEAGAVYLAKTLFLILSNFAFLPAVILALYYGLFSEALIYASTMVSSIFYHTCDQESLSKSLPLDLHDFCLSLYVNNEVLQFCDFYCAILSFWITIVALARLPHKVVHFLNMFGVLLVAFLVQYNRTGIEVLFVPIFLGLLVILLSLLTKSILRKKMYLPNRVCFTLLIPAAICSIIAACLTAFVETTHNYAVIHSVWHILMAGALLFLVPRCREKTSEQIASSTSAATLDDGILNDAASLSDTGTQTTDEEAASGDSVSGPPQSTYRTYECQIHSDASQRAAT